MVEIATARSGAPCRRRLSAFFLEAHQAFGARVPLGVGVAAIDGGEAARSTRSSLPTASVLPADLVIVGVGVLAEDALARAGGRSPAPTGSSSTNSWRPPTRRSRRSAIARSFRSRSLGAPLRLESVQNADRPGPLRRPPAGRQARALRRAAVVLERPGRPQAADRRAVARRRSLGRCAAIRRAAHSRRSAFAAARWRRSRRSTAPASTWRRGASSAPACRFGAEQAADPNFDLRRLATAPPR